MPLLHRRRTVLLLIATAALLSAAALLWLTLKTGPAPPSVKLYLGYRVTIQNPTNQAIRNASVRVNCPAANTGFQQRLNISADHPFEKFSLQPAAPQSIAEALLFQWDIFPPFASKVITIRSVLNLWETPRKQTVPDPGVYLQTEPFIESDHPRVIALAASLKGRTPLQTIENTFAWVSGNITHSGYVRRTRGALYAIDHRQGDCTEFACLFTALCRANGIPARVVGGFVCPQSAILDFGEYHNWAEFFYKGRWHVADPQRKRLMREQQAYVAFHHWQPSTGAHEPPLVAIIAGDPLVIRPSRQ